MSHVLHATDGKIAVAVQKTLRLVMITLKSAAVPQAPSYTLKLGFVLRVICLAQTVVM